MAGKHIRYDATNKKFEFTNAGDATGFADLEIAQILFPGTQIASSNANSLDDYEEGTFTPVLGGVGGTSGQTYSSRSGFYIKIYYYHSVL